MAINFDKYLTKEQIKALNEAWENMPVIPITISSTPVDRNPFYELMEAAMKKEETTMTTNEQLEHLFDSFRPGQMVKVGIISNEGHFYVFPIEFQVKAVDYVLILEVAGIEPALRISPGCVRDLACDETIWLGNCNPEDGTLSLVFDGGPDGYAKIQLVV